MTDPTTPRPLTAEEPCLDRGACKHGRHSAACDFYQTGWREATAAAARAIAGVPGLVEALEGMVAAAVRMPDAALAVGDPRYDWWWNIMVPAKAKALATLVAHDHVAALAATPPEPVCGFVHADSTVCGIVDYQHAERIHSHPFTPAATPPVEPVCVFPGCPDWNPATHHHGPSADCDHRPKPACHAFTPAPTPPTSAAGRCARRGCGAPESHTVHGIHGGDGWHPFQPAPTDREAGA